MSSRRPDHLYFCNFCKGNVQLTRHRIKQHVKIYGLWDVEKSKGGPSTPKKSRVSSSSESDSEAEEAHVAPRLAKEDTHFEDVCDDFPVDFDSDGADTESTTLKVMKPLCDP